MTKKSILWIAAGGILLVAAGGAAAWGPIVSNVEQPKYRVVETADNIEIRDYAPMIVAETDVTGEQRKALGHGFRAIAGYIFGDNLSAKKVAMTAPVTQQSNEKIAMTAPVTQQGDGGNWHVRSRHASRLHHGHSSEAEESRGRTQRNSGAAFCRHPLLRMGGEESLKRRTNELEAFIKAKNLHSVSAPTYAYYNPPWTLPFLRRNEVMIEIAR